MRRLLNAREFGLFCSLLVVGGLVNLRAAEPWSRFHGENGQGVSEDMVIPVRATAVTFALAPASIIVLPNTLTLVMTTDPPFRPSFIPWAGADTIVFPLIERSVNVPCAL